MAQATVDLADAPSSLTHLAATWLERFYPDVKLAFGQHSITLQSSTHESEHLERMWRAALLNEQLLEASSGRRRSILEALFQ